MRSTQRQPTVFNDDPESLAAVSVGHFQQKCFGNALLLLLLFIINNDNNDGNNDDNNDDNKFPEFILHHLYF